MHCYCILFYQWEQILPMHFNGIAVDFYGVRIAAKVCSLLIEMCWRNPLIGRMFSRCYRALTSKSQFTAVATGRLQWLKGRVAVIRTRRVLDRFPVRTRATLGIMSKSSWARFWTPNCSRWAGWCFAWFPPPSVYECVCEWVMQHNLWSALD